MVRGAAPTGLKRSHRTLIKTKTSKPPNGGGVPLTDLLGQRTEPKQNYHRPKGLVFPDVL